MAVVPETQRVEELRKRGLSEALIRLSTGELLHEVFRFECQGPPYMIYDGELDPPRARIAPLWDCGDAAVAVSIPESGVEFIQIDVECPDQVRVLAKTEQGFWTIQFNAFLEFGEAMKAVEEAARVVGFRFLSKLIDERATRRGHRDDHESFTDWLNRIVQDVDTQAT